MYEKTTTKQLVFDFALPFRGNLNPDNRWVKKSTQIPWEYVEEVYRKRLSRSDQGRKAFSGRIAFGSLIIQETLGTTGRETAAQISENPYLQFFLGYVRRNLQAINRYAGQHRLGLLSSRLYRLLLVVHEVYRQQI